MKKLVLLLSALFLFGCVDEDGEEVYWQLSCNSGWKSPVTKAAYLTNKLKWWDNALKAHTTRSIGLNEICVKERVYPLRS